MVVNIYAPAGPTYKNSYIHGSRFNAEMTTHKAAGPLYKTAIYTALFFSVQTCLCTWLPGLHIKMAICTAAVFSTNMDIHCIHGLHNATYKNDMCMAAVFITKMAVYMTAGSTYESGCIHGSCFQYKHGYKHGCRAFI